MDPLLSPGRLLLDRLSFSKKFSLIILVFLLPISYTTWLDVQNQQQRIDFIDKEIQGLDLLIHYRSLFTGLAQHRGMTNGYLGGNESFKSKIQELRPVINNGFDQLIQADRSAPGYLKNSQAIQAAKSTWDKLQQEAFNGPADTVFERHSALIQQLFRSMQETQDLSLLSLDPNVDSHYLVELVLNTLPELAEQLGQARGLAAGIAAQQNFTTQSRVELAIQYEAVKQQLKNATLYLQSAAEESTLVAAKQGDINLDLARKFVAILDSRMLNSSKIEVSSSAVFSAGTEAISGVLKLYDEGLPLLRKQLQTRRDTTVKAEITTLGIEIVAVIVAFYLFIAFYSSTRQAIDRIHKVAQNMAEGNLSQRIEIQSQDEMAEVASYINQVGERLSTIVREMLTSGNEVYRTANNIQNLSSQMQVDIEKQNSQTDSVGSAMNQMTSTTEHMADNSANTANAAANATQVALKGQQEVEHTIKLVSSLVTSIESGSGSIEQLARESEQIDTVLEVINSIAEQTNLLALNAAIEAARAGEHGRGFAVVADEVRSLASRTQESTTEIRSMIDGLKSRVSETHQIMDQGRKHSEDSMGQAQSAGKSLNEIIRAVTEIRDLSSGIASATEQQKLATAEVNRSIDLIISIADDTARGSQNSLSASQDLTVLANKLQQTIHQFKL